MEINVPLYIERTELGKNKYAKGLFIDSKTKVAIVKLETEVIRPSHYFSSCSEV